MTNPPGSLAGLIAALPEIYQPIFGHPELSTQTLRGCEDRLFFIEQIYKLLEAKLNRPLCVLDLGCAQGYFSLSLAKLGATVHGVDLFDGNIDVCQALAAEHSDLKVSFEGGLVEETIIQLEHMRYDLVLGLSVFHHIAHHLGSDSVQKMLAILAAKSVAGIYEMALASEPLPWAASLPADPRELLSDYAFVHELARNKSHLSDTHRPLYVASNRYCFLGPQAEAFYSWKAESHEFTRNKNGGSRRYFFGNGCIIKQLFLNHDKFHAGNVLEHANEIVFLSSPPDHFKVPQLFAYGQDQREAWLIREQLPGELLLDKIRSKKPYDAERILKDVLQQLAAAEAAGFYHNDLRTWNILIRSNGHATVIDYGAMSRNKKDGGWPYNIFLSFMIFMHDVLYGEATVSPVIRTIAFNPQSFPAPYSMLLWRLFEHTPEEWSFTFLSDALSQPLQKDMHIPAATKLSLATILNTMESACKIHLNTAAYLRQQITTQDLEESLSSNSDIQSLTTLLF